jgi:diguanylate cyclase (GGDEF)-like protein
MRVLPFLLAISLAIPTFAQSAATAQQWVKEAEKLQDDDPAAALRLLERALPLLRLAAQPSARMDARRAQCWSTAVVDGSKVPPVVAAALEEATSINHLAAMADLELCRGYAFETTGKVNEAAADYELAVRDGERSGDQKVWADALVLRGEMFSYRGQFTAAIDDLQQAYTMNVALKRESKQRYALNAIANLYADRRVGAYDRAIEYYRQLLAAHQKRGSLRDMATARFNIAATLETKGELQAALDEYQRALKLEQERKDPDAVADVQRPLGVVLGKLGRLDEGLAMLDAALARFRQTDEESAAQTQLARGVVLRKLGRTREALAELDAARSQFIRTKSDRFLERTEEERALALAALGDFRGALHARTSQLDLRQKLAEQSRDEHVSRLRVQFETEKKERENAVLLRENQLRQRENTILSRENAFRARALDDAARIRRLQAIAIALGGIVIGVLVYLVVRHLTTARRMRDLALTDELTKLPNRRHLLAFADEQLRAARAGGKPFSMLALDIDHFKRINDTRGHDAGDVVLRTVAQTCQAALRQHDRIGRTGGEEFLVVLPETDARNAADIAERLRVAVEATGVTISIGVTEWTAADDFTALARRADDCLYRAKEQGRNRVELAYA